MSKLQNNFTTPEQSKRLLELGVPADSSDFYYTWKLDHTAKINVLDNETYSELLDHISQITIPCWSVGRLIEIMNICSMWGHVSIHRTDREVTQIEQLIEILQNRINGKTIDFAKLEE